MTVLGSPGVGKTRLAREIATSAAASAGASTFEIRCDRAGNATFAPIAQLIRDAAGLDDDATADDARGRIAELLAADDERARLTEILAAMVAAVLASRTATLDRSSQRSTARRPRRDRPGAIGSGPTRRPR